MKQRFSFLLATFLGIGYVKVAPGTIGSLITLPLAFVLAYFYCVNLPEMADYKFVSL